VTNDRVITSGLLMFTTAEKGFELLPGQLGLDLATGYMCPIQPAIADGRMFIRLADKLVCYDLRKDPANEFRRSEFVARDALFGRGGEANDIRLWIREKNGTPVSLEAEKPDVSGPERSEVASWIYENSHVQRRSSLLSDFDGSGDVTVRVGYQWESWHLDTNAGTYTRRALPLPEPVEVKGGTAGQIKPLPDGARLWNHYLGGAAGGSSLRQGEADAALSIAVVQNADGTIRNAWAAGGRINRAIHEVDWSGLTIEGDRLQGEVTVLFHDDAYFDMHFVSAQAEKRNSGRGGLLAARYTLNTTINSDNNLGGNWSGTIGIPWEKKGTLAPTPN
jgi:hypothetical protein